MLNKIKTALKAIVYKLRSYITYPVETCEHAMNVIPFGPNTLTSHMAMVAKGIIGLSLLTGLGVLSLVVKPLDTTVYEPFTTAPLEQEILSETVDVFATIMGSLFPSENEELDDTVDTLPTATPTQFCFPIKTEYCPIDSHATELPYVGW